MTTAKRDTLSTCLHCGHPIQQDGIGRTRQYCSDACKTAACRQRRRRQHRQNYAEVSAVYLAEKIGELQAENEYPAGDALRRLASDHGVQLDEALIQASEAKARQLTVSLDALLGFSNAATVTKWEAGSTGRGVSEVQP
jgi:predicted nucleic acid-binding Zn ribbon protein